MPAQKQKRGYPASHELLVIEELGGQHASVGDRREELEHRTLHGSGVEIETLIRRRGDPSPLVVVLHGWGDDASKMTAVGMLAYSAGFGVALISMRGWGRSGGRDDAGLEQPDDIVRVVRHLGNEAWVLDGAVGLLGVSQGGQVALLAAARGAPVRAVAAWAPVTDLDEWRATTRYPGIVAYIDSTCGDDTRRRSPVDVAGQITAPVLLIHGTADTRVPKEQSELMSAALRRSGCEIEHHLLPGIGHGGPDAVRLAWEVTAPFFSRHLQ